jgi:subtilisin family serine protease
MEEYFWSGGRKVPLQRDPEVMAVKFRIGPAGRAPLEAEALSVLRERLEPAGFVGHRGIKIYRTPTQPRAVEVLSRQHAVEFASPAYRRNPGSEELMFVTNQFLAQFRPEVTEARLAEINARHGVRIVNRLDYADNAYTLEPEAPGQDVVRLANIYREQEPTEWSHPVLLRRQARKGAVAAPARAGLRTAPPRPAMRRGVERVVPHDRRWHLGSAQTRVTEAWALPGLAAGRARGAPEIRVAVLDDGVEVTHAEFAGRVVAQFDFEEGVADANPKGDGDNHGTACAGVALAAGVNAASGAAPGCSLIAARTPSLLGVDEEARMFKWAADQGADVISCSWGPADGTGSVDPLPDNVAAAIRYCVTRGRGGRGIPIFWAAGNGDESVSLDGYAACPDVIAVAASTSRNSKAWYSDFGPEIWICAPSSGDDAADELSIFTTDRSGAAGYNAGDAALGDATGTYTGDFGGTSSATPLAAGIAALMLSANPELHENPTSARGREMREILAATAAKIGSGYADGHSPQFGFGRIDAAAAVREALRRSSVSPPATLPEAVVDGPASWPRDGGPPTFRVDPGAGRFYAVEVATETALFDADTRGPGPLPVDRFYASWDEAPLFSATSYPVDWTLPEHAWRELLAAPRLYYRVWGSDEASAWTRAVASTPDADHGSAPSILLTEAEDDRTTGDRKVAITAPAGTPRDGQPPLFMVDPGPGRFFAVEVAVDRALLAHDEDTSEARRGPDTYFASWDEAMLLPAAAAPSAWRLPAAAWERLRSAPALYYRAWSSSHGDRWADILSSLGDEEARLHAPAIQIGEADAPRRSGREVRTAPGGPRPAMLRYGSGAELPLADPSTAGKGIDYAEPAGVAGAAPLVTVAYRLDRPLSAAFRVRDFASRLDAEDAREVAYADHARIAPALVEAVRRVAAEARPAVAVTAGYLHPSLAAEWAGAGRGGQGLEWHVAGLAADLRASGGRPLDLARRVLETLGGEIGLGLLPDGVHLDLRPGAAAWAEPGAELDSNAFEDWVREVLREAEGVSRREAGERTAGTAVARAVLPLPGAGFAVTGPDAHPQDAPEPPAFLVEFTGSEACRIEVATAEELLGTQEAAAGRVTIRSEPLRPAEGQATRLWRMPVEAWHAARGAGRISYRAVADGAAGDAAGASAASPVGVVVLSGQTLKSRGRLLRQLPDPISASVQDELRWRGSPHR